MADLESIITIPAVGGSVWAAGAVANYNPASLIGTAGITAAEHSFIPTSNGLQHGLSFLYNNSFDINAVNNGSPHIIGACNYNAATGTTTWAQGGGLTLGQGVSVTEQEMGLHSHSCANYLAQNGGEPVLTPNDINSFSIGGFLTGSFLYSGVATFYDGLKRLHLCKKTDKKQKVIGGVEIGGGLTLAGLGVKGLVNLSNMKTLYDTSLATGNYVQAISTAKSMASFGSGALIGLGAGFLTGGVIDLIRACTDKVKKEDKTDYAVRGGCKIGAGALLAVQGVKLSTLATSSWFTVAGSASTMVTYCSAPLNAAVSGSLMTSAGSVGAAGFLGVLPWAFLPIGLYAAYKICKAVKKWYNEKKGNKTRDKSSQHQNKSPVLNPAPPLPHETNGLLPLPSPLLLARAIKPLITKDGADIPADNLDDYSFVYDSTKSAVSYTRAGYNDNGTITSDELVKDLKSKLDTSYKCAFYQSFETKNYSKYKEVFDTVDKNLGAQLCGSGVCVIENQLGDFKGLKGLKKGLLSIKPPNNLWDKHLIDTNVGANAGDEEYLFRYLLLRKSFENHSDKIKNEHDLLYYFIQDNSKDNGLFDRGTKDATTGTYDFLPNAWGAGTAVNNNNNVDNLRNFDLLAALFELNYGLIASPFKTKLEKKLGLSGNYSMDDIFDALNAKSP